MHRSVAEQRRQVEKWLESGLSISAYCKKQGISTSSFSYWKSKHSAEAKYVPVVRELSCAPETIELESVSGVKLRVSGSSSVERLSELVKCLV
jgi:transposase-like protein